jgi:hypothetical protein
MLIHLKHRLVSSLVSYLTRCIKEPNWINTQREITKGKPFFNMTSSYL